MKYYIVAGEASGDLHGSNLIREIIKKDPAAEIRFWGGELMEAAGGELRKHYRELAFMGFIEVVKNLSTILRNLKFCKEEILAFNPDVVVLIDYPGFNLRIAQWARGKGFRTAYYISPTVWAWKENRVKTIREAVDKMIVILPFEKPFYESRWNYKVDYVGHPLVHVIEDFKKNFKPSLHFDKPVIALLPGSRKQELLTKLPVMLKATKAFPGYQFVVARAPALDEAIYHEMLADYPEVATVTSRTYELLSISRAALVASGTATLETALFGVPQVVCYIASPVTYHIAKRLIRIKYLSLVNLIMDRPVVKELIQKELTAENITRELNLLLHDDNRIRQIMNDYRELENILSQSGNPSEKAAAIVTSLASAKKELD